MAVKHRVKTDGKGNTAVKTLTHKTAIFHHCRECMGFQSHMVKHCTNPECALFPFRMESKFLKGVTC